MLIQVYIKLKLFIYIWLHWAFVAVLRISLIAVSRALLFIAVCWLLFVVASHYGAQALGEWASAVAAHGSSEDCGTETLVAPGHVESSQPGIESVSPAFGRWILIY